MIDSRIMARAAADLAALDFTAENSQIGSLEEEIATASRAKERANERISEIGDALVSARQPAAHAVADALLAELDPSEAAKESPSRESLESEREALRSGVRELQARILNLEGQLASVRTAARRRLAVAARPLVDTLIVEAKTAAEQVVECYVSLKALHLATGGGTRELAFAKDAIDGFSPAHGGLLPPRMTLDVPPEIVSALESVSTKGPAIRSAAPTTISTR